MKTRSKNLSSQQQEEGSCEIGSMERGIKGEKSFSLVRDLLVNDDVPFWSAMSSIGKSPRQQLSVLTPSSLF